MAAPQDLRDVVLELRDGVAVVTLDRPDRRNAFTGPMGDSLGRLYEWADVTDEVRVVVVTGAGDAFCAGADLTPAGETFAAPAGGEGGEGARPFTSSPIGPLPWRIRKPVIAAVNGHAIGIGMTIAMQCDIRVMAVGAKYGFVHVRRGVIPDAHSHWTVPRAAGFANAAELLLTGRHFTAEDALRMGIASQALPADDVLPAALEQANDIATNTAPLSVAISKRLLWADPPLTADEADRLETLMHLEVMGREDAKEGVLAFLERRAPTWTLSPTRDWPAGLDPTD
jgi:enoyl-CoA hydratase/carnithine racemase